LNLNPLELSEKLKKTYIDYMRSVLRIRNIQLNRSFNEKLNSFPFIKGPYLEARPPFKSGVLIGDLIKKGFLNGNFTDFIYDVFPYLKDNPLYLHQEQAIIKAYDNRNLIITTGTGSGKTECFLFPILNHILNENDLGTINNEIRALIIYPLNALANDQIRRLREILYVIERKRPDLKITFGRFTGETEEKPGAALEKFRIENPNLNPPKGEILSREEIRNNPMKSIQ